MDKLKPCPFCGGKVRVAVTGDDGQLVWFVTRGLKAGKCTCRVFMESECFYSDTPEKEKQRLKMSLVEAWNRRVGESDG